MRNDRPKRGSRSLEKATVSNMWEIAAIVELGCRAHVFLSVVSCGPA